MSHPVLIGLKLLWQQLLLPSLVIASILLGAYGETSRSSYCKRCGLRKSEASKKMFGLSIQREENFKDTGYHDLYSQFVSANCNHDWRSYSRGWMQGYGALLGAGVACGYLPAILLPDKDVQLRKFNRFRNRVRMIKLLKALSPGSQQTVQQSRILSALDDLDRVKTRADEDAWWHSYQRLYRIKLP